MPEKDASPIDIFGMLSEDNADEARKKRRQELLAGTGVKDLFKDGKISINKFTCAGAQCRLCVNACPTNALYWSNGQIGITEDLCVYCGACVSNCMVDDCIKIERQREDGKIEKFSKPNDVVLLDDKISGKKRFERVKAIFPTITKYCENYCNAPKDEHVFFCYVNKNANKRAQKQQKLRRHNRGNS